MVVFYLLLLLFSVLLVVVVVLVPVLFLVFDNVACFRLNTPSGLLRCFSGFRWASPRVFRGVDDDVTHTHARALERSLRRGRF